MNRERSAGFVEPARAMLFCVFVWVLVLALRALAFGQEPPRSMDLERSVREQFDNPDGSCVQCSNGMLGWHWRNENLATLLWSTHYGPAIRGGSSPSRVASYCRSRGIPIYNVTGEQNCRAMMDWAWRTNRFAGIGFKPVHFCTLYSHTPGAAEPWGVCDNNRTHTLDTYTEAEFRRVHMQSGPWVVIPDGPAPASPPEPTAWWE